MVEIERGALVGVAAHDSVGYGLALPNGSNRTGVEVTDLARIERDHQPRWVWLDRTTPAALVACGVHLARCWDVLVLHRLQHGGWCDSVPDMWIARHRLDPDRAPRMGQLDLLAAGADSGGDPDDPIRPDGYLRPEWTSGGWADTPSRMAKWATLARTLAREQIDELDRTEPHVPSSIRFSESAAELLCAELAHDGLPFDPATATTIIEGAVGPRPRDDRAAETSRSQRDQAVLALVPPGPPIDLRNPVDVKAMLRRIELDLPDTRAWRLEQHLDHHPLVPALLRWRKAERLSNTYGYRWLDEHVRDGRLRGEWSSSDGAAGRMTASSGLHNLPAELRPAVRADQGWVLVRADLGQIEPRILAAVSGDAALIAATQGDDLYQPVADRLRVSRDVAKVAILGAMYGSTTGESANALRGLEREYPVAMQLLQHAADTGYRGEVVHTHGGRPVHMWDHNADGDIDHARRVAAARGRFARNAVIQGSAAEFFKMWAVTVRARGHSIGASVVLCLHDELLVHAPAAQATEVAAMVDGAVSEAAYRWSPHRDVRFVVDTSIVQRWSDAKVPTHTFELTDASSGSLIRAPNPREGRDGRAR